MKEIELISMNGNQFLDSRDVAKMLGKQHAHLMRDIKKFINDISTNPNLDRLNFFIESNYVDAKGETRKYYLVTKQGCEVLANKMTGKKGNQFTARYVELFNKMKEQVSIPAQFNIPRTLPEALRLAADQAEQLEKLESSNKVMKLQLDEANKKASYLDMILGTPDALTITQIAFDYDKSAKKFNELLHEVGIQHKVNGQWILYKAYMGKGYTVTKTYPFKDSQGKSRSNPLTLWTQKGRKLIYDVLKEHGILPMIERDDIA